MTVLFIHPPLQTRVSGGNIYNRHIIRQAYENHYPLVSLPIDDIEDPGLLRKIARRNPRLLIWDSLFFDSVRKGSLAFGPMRSALLVHYLPSDNLSLDSSSKTKLRHLESTAIQNCGRVVCTGSMIFKTLIERHPKKAVFLCRPGVEEFFQPANQNPVPRAGPKTVNLISVANLLPDKGYLEILEALSDLKSPGWAWHIVGSGSHDRSFGKRFQSAARARGLLPRIRFHGVLNQETLAGLFGRMDLFVNASRYEAYGMAVAEAVAAGLPAVSTRTGDAAEMILDGDSGLLVEVGDRSALRNALEELIRNPDLRQQFREKSLTRPWRSWKNCFETFRRACDFDR